MAEFGTSTFGDSFFGSELVASPLITGTVKSVSSVAARINVLRAVIPPPPPSTGENPQPVLPPEVAFTEAELNFMDEEPPGFFPENQNSNFGLVRKLLSDKFQEVNDQITTLGQERFVSSSTEFLNLHELEVGLPPNPANVDIQHRRLFVLSRIRKGLFTRELRDSVISSFVAAAIGGTAISLTPSGVALVPDGVPLYGDISVGATSFRVIEDIERFSYVVQIQRSITPDLLGLYRELQRITPAGILFSIDNTQSW